MTPETGNQKRVIEAFLRERALRDAELTASTPLVLRQRAQLASLLLMLEDLEWSTPERLQTLQRTHFAALWRHHLTQNQAYRTWLASKRAAQADRDVAAVPFLMRADVQQHGESFICRNIPAQHGAISITQTSGSTGQPVKVARTARAFLYWAAYTMRDHIWQGRDFSQKLGVIRANALAYGHYANWGQPASLLVKTGPLVTMLTSVGYREQLAWLVEHKPGYLLGYGSNIAMVFDEAQATGVSLGFLRDVRVIGETCPPALMQKLRMAIGGPVKDCYSSQEVGVIATQCVHSDLYHLSAENLIVEILNDADKPCAPGEIGRVVITDLHNYAMPLIRYEIGDHAEVGPPCPCGRVLPTLRRIMGRTRHMVRLPNGGKSWPLVGFHHYHTVADVRQFQIVQKAFDRLEARMVVKGGLNEGQKQQLAAIICKRLGVEADVDFVLYDTFIPRGPNGKFEDFICEIRDA